MRPLLAKMKNLKKSVLVLLFALINFVASQQTIGGVFSVDTVLDLSGSPYTVNANIFIERDVSLTIEPGVELRFNPGVGMQVDGSLIADGSETQRITLTATDSQETSDGYSWDGIQWLPGAGSDSEFIYSNDMVPVASSTSILRYVDVSAAGAIFSDDGSGTLLFSGIGPALQGVGDPPILENVFVGENFGIGVEWHDITGVAVLSHCNITNNAEEGLTFTSSDGIGKLLMSGCVIEGNGNDGISMDLNRPDNSLSFPRYEFCPFAMDIDSSVYLEHDVSDFTSDPLECTQVISSPPGTTIAVYITSGSRSSDTTAIPNYVTSGPSDYGTEVSFWNGNSTNDFDLISTRHPSHIYGSLISSTTNTMTIRVSRPYSWNSVSIAMFIVVHKGLCDVDISDSRFVNNNGNGISAQNYRKISITDSFIGSNKNNGISINENYGRVELTRVVVDSNDQSGFLSNRDYGELSITGSDFVRNGGDGVRVRAYSLQFHTFSMVASKSSSSSNGANGMYIDHASCSNAWWLLLSEGSFVGNTRSGLQLDVSDEYCSNVRNSIEVSKSTFAENQNAAIDMYAIDAIDINDNLFLNNTGEDTVCWRLPHGYVDGDVIIRNNNFSNNYGMDVVRVLSSDSSTFIRPFAGNVFENNRCFQVLAIELGQYNTNNQEETILVFDNVFKDNVPRAFLQPFAHIIPIATVTSDMPFVSFICNTFDNQLFPYEIAIIGDFYGDSINGTNNFWATVVESEIQDRIYDSSDNYQLCTVVYFPYLLSQDKGNIADENTPRSVPAFQRGSTVGGVVDGNEMILYTGSEYFADRDIIIRYSTACISAQNLGKLIGSYKRPLC